jgi:tape measure domain-containing protein
MARKDVSLVIRARDEAKGVLREITKAVEAFNASTDELVGDAGKVDSALGQMGSAIGDLRKSVNDLDFNKRLTDDLARAEARLASMNEKLGESTADFNRLEKATSEAKQELAKMRAEVEAATAAEEKASAAKKKAKTDLASLNTEMKKNATAQRNAQKSISTVTKTLEGQQSRLDESTAKFERLSKEIAEVEKPNKRLTDSFASAERRVISHTEALTKTQAKLAEVEQRVETLTAEEAELAGKVKVASTALKDQTASADAAAAALKAKKTAAAGLVKEQRDLEAATEAARNKALRQKDAVDRDTQAFKEMGASVDVARDRLKSLESVTLRGLTNEVTKQRTATVLAEEEARQLAGTLDRLKASTQGVPTRELARDLRFAEQAADEAALKFMLQSEVLDRMNAVMAESGADTVSLAGKTERLGRAQQQLARDMAELSGDGLRARNVIRGLERAYDEAAQAAREKAATSGKVSGAQQRELSVTERLAAAYRNLHRGQRTSLSLMQRIRGEALSLAAAYGGLFAAIEVLRGTTEATQKLEAATARLNVANDGDLTATANDLDFVRRNADRLGIEFGVLGTEYSKFSIATKNTNLEGDATRKIFNAVAEAARVNRSSTQEMAGVFTALTQIVSKGAVQMEELRQQLGDRLPGALQLMADGLNVSSAELIKMMEAGEVTADALIPFADELNKRFGPGLAESLSSTANQLGRLKNALFEAMLVLGSGGFVDALGDLAETLVEVLQSADFETFLRNLSGALAALMNGLGVLAENWQMVSYAMSAFMAVKILPYILKIGTAFTTARASILATAASLRTAGAAGGTAAGGIRAATGATVGLTAAVRSLIASTGVGIAVVGLSMLFTHWVTEADAATEVLANHESMVAQLRNTYEDTDGSLDAYREAIAGLDDITLDKLQGQLDSINDAMDETIAKMNNASNRNDSFWTNFFGFNLSSWNRALSVSEDYQNEIKEIIRQFKDGEISAQEMSDAVGDVNLKYRDGSDDHQEYAAQMRIVVAEAVKLADATEEVSDAITVQTGETDEAVDAMERLNNIAEEVSETMEERLVRQSNDFNAAMEALAQKVPELKEEMDRLAEIDAIEQLRDEAVAAAVSIGQVTAAFERAAAAKAALNDVGALTADDYSFDYARQAAAGAGSQNEEIVRAAVAVAEELGVAAADLLTVMSYESAGTMDPRIVGTDAAGNEYHGLGQFSPDNRERYGVDRLSSATEQIIALGEYLRDRGIQEGDGLHRIYAAINTGTPDGGDRTDEHNGGAPGTADDKVNEQMDGHRARAEGLLDAYGGVVNEVENLTAEQRRAAEEAARQAEATDARLAAAQQEIDQQELINAGLERQAAIEAAIAEARSENPNVSDEEIAAIAERAGRLYDLQNANAAAEEAAKKAAEAE